jgi:hypothetical protein
MEANINLNPETLKKVMDSLKINKSPGPDGVHPRTLYELRDILCRPLSIIFNTSLCMQELPKDWKIANVTAIYKKGSKKVAGNYRPVSLTSIVCKLMETVVRDVLVDYMKNNGLFSERQFGFINGRSTVLQLLQVIDKWVNILDEGGCIDVVYCDFMKAFDKVPHIRLIEKLKYYGIGEPIIGWITQFLKDRKQRVVVNGSSSGWHDVLSGIPQGSVLGPVLFVIYINTLPDSVTESEAYLFADDTKVFKGIFSEEDTNALQRDIDEMYKWTQGSLLRFHPEKCVAMRIGKSKIAEKEYYMGPERQEIKRSSIEKDIGVFIDEKLSFETHIETKVNKANATMGIIRRTYEHLDEKSFLLLYKALVRPHIEYANQVWAPNLKKHIIEIENVQRRATKQLPGLSDLTYEQRLRKLKLPTLNYRRTRGDMIEMYKIITGKYDPAVSDFVVKNNQDPNTRGHKYKLQKKSCRLNITKNSFVHRSVNVWNNLPRNVVEATSVKSFEHRLDRHWQSQPFMYNFDYTAPTASADHFDLTPEASAEACSQKIVPECS